MSAGLALKADHAPSHALRARGKEEGERNLPNAFPTERPCRYSRATLLPHHTICFPWRRRRTGTLGEPMFLSLIIPGCAQSRLGSFTAPCFPMAFLPLVIPFYLGFARLRRAASSPPGTPHSCGSGTGIGRTCRLKPAFRHRIAWGGALSAALAFARFALGGEIVVATLIPSDIFRAPSASGGGWG